MDRTPQSELFESFQHPSFSLSCLAELKHYSTCCHTHWPLLHRIRCWKQYTSDSLQQRWSAQIILSELGDCLLSTAETCRPAMCKNSRLSSLNECLRASHHQNFLLLASQCVQQQVWLCHLSPVYTQCLTQIGIWIKLIRIRVNTLNSDWNPDYITHLRMWVEPGLNPD